jgi:hypothetical protein
MGHARLGLAQLPAARDRVLDRAPGRAERCGVLGLDPLGEVA